MRIDDAALMAYAMGDLSPAAAARIEEALENDPRLAARLDRIRGVRQALRTVYDSVAAEPVPERLRALLGDVAASEATAQKPPPARAPAWRAAPVYAALAIGAILGVIVGRLMPDGSLFTAESGAMRAAPALARVLDTRLSDAPENAAAAVRVGVSFMAQGGALCRVFTQPARRLAGLACREGERWTLRTLETADAATDAAALNAMIDDIMVGAPFDALAERAALANGWRAAAAS